MRQKQPVALRRRRVANARQHQLAREGVGYCYAAKKRCARDRFPAWLAMDEDRYIAMRKHLDGLAAEQQRRDAVAPMRSHDDKVAAFRSRGIDDRLVGTIILDLCQAPFCSENLVPAKTVI